MKNRGILALLSVIALLLGANLLVMSADTSYAQDRPERRERPQRPDVQERPGRPDDGRAAPQRRTRCVGVTAVNGQLYVAFDDGTVEARSVK